MITDQAQFLKKLPSPLFKLAAQAYVDYKFPRHLFIETTSTCNLSCNYCPREKTKNDMDFGLFMKIVEEASQYGSRSFSLHLFGEPLLYPYWMSAINYIKARNKNHTVLLTTNGTKINENIDVLTRLPIDKCLWSWRKEAKFTEETKSKLRKWKPFTVRYIEGTYPESALEEKWPRVERRRMHNYGATIDLSLFTFQESSARNVDSKASSIRWPCYHLFLAPAIAWNGKFLMCCADPHQKEIFGDIKKESVNVAWQRVERVKKAHLSGQFIGICANCDTWREYPNLFFGHKYASS